MPNPFRSMLRAPLAVPAGILAAAVALACGAGLSGCKTVEIEGPDTDTTVVTADSAIIRVSNKIDQDPGTITLILFPGSAVDIANAKPTKRLGVVAYGATNKPMKVPAGTWKLGYEDRSGVLYPMVDDNSAAQDWLKSIFKKDGDYALILDSDGNRTIWNPTFPTDPKIE